MVSKLMVSKIDKFFVLLKKHAPYISVGVIVTVVLVIAQRNYVAGTWLTGWDNTHPEFDFYLNIKRAFFTVWRENRGLGVVGGLSHAAHLPLYIIWWVLSWFFTPSFIRYLWQFLMLLIGPLGVYVFVKNYLLYSASKKVRDSSEMAALLGALFYIFNLATVQAFYIPLETFTAHYGFLPWLFFTTLHFIRKGDFKYLLYFAILTIISSSQAFTSTLFFAYLIVLGFSGLYVIVFATPGKRTFKLKNAIILALTLLALNLYWLLPLGYFLKTSAHMVPDSTINVLASEESFYLNMKFGTIKDIALLKGFPFTTTDFQEYSESFTPLLQPWEEHFTLYSNITIYGYLLFVIVLLGIVGVVVSRLTHNRYELNLKVGFLFFNIFLICLFFLSGINSPLAFLFNFMQDNIPFFREALRFPFTKFSIITAFTYSVLFSYGVYMLQAFILRQRTIFKIPFFIFLFSLMVIWAFPVFTGNLLYRNMKNEIPQEYFAAFEWFDNQDIQNRVLKLPVHTYWSWGYNSWGYRGSGFTWFGIKQPTIDRAFDIWGEKNEGVYHEITHAVYSGDSNQFKKVLEKYDTQYIFMDDSIYEPRVDNDAPFMGTSIINGFLEDTTSFEQVFKQGYVRIYKYKGLQSANNFVYKVPSVLNTYRDYRWTSLDLPYETLGNTIVGSDSTDYIYMPFTSIEDHSHKSVIVEKSADRFIFTADIPVSGLVTIPSVFESTDKIPYEVSVENQQLVVKPLIPEVFIGGKKVYGDMVYAVLSVRAPSNAFLVTLNGQTFGPIGNANENKVIGNVYLSPNIEHKVFVSAFEEPEIVNLTDKFRVSRVDSCFEKDFGYYEVEFTENGFNLSSKGSTACIAAKVADSINGLVSIVLEEAAVKATSKYCLYNSELKTGCYNDNLLNNYMFFENSISDPIVQVYSEPTTLTVDSITRFSDVLLKKYALLNEYTLSPIKENKLMPKISDFVEESSSEVSLEVRVPVRSDVRNTLMEDFRNENLDEFVHECNYNNIKEAGVFSTSFSKFNKVARLASRDEYLCMTLSNDDLTHDTGYLVSVANQKLSGKNQKMCLQNGKTYRCDVIYDLSAGVNNLVDSIFVTPPMQDGGNGYKVIIENVSVGSELAENIYDNVELVPLPYEFIKEIGVVSSFEVLKKVTDFSSVVKEPVVAKHPNPSKYLVKEISVGQGETLVLSQTYEDGWVAYCGFGKCNAEHVLVNNWANGWEFNDSYSGPVKIVFWPQVLEYIGFLIAAGTFLGISVKYYLKRK